jgi:hypothetical protein
MGCMVALSFIDHSSASFCDTHKHTSSVPMSGEPPFNSNTTRKALKRLIMAGKVRSNHSLLN